nr:polyprenyl diphosphate synthase [Rhizobiaceae bacterium]
VEYLTLYSFSTENWSRPESEVSELFSLLRLFIRRDLADLHKSNVRVVIIGSRERVPADLLNLLDEAQNLTAENTGQTLVIAFNYGARDEIINATRLIAEQVAAGKISPDQINEQLIGGFLYTYGIPEPDLLIRTSGEKRLSNFLLWQLAYSEFMFMDCLWPDFGKEHLAEAIDAYCTRNRRFGGLVRETAS